jgi:hypothetical protein
MHITEIVAEIQETEVPPATKQEEIPGDWKKVGEVPTYVLQAMSLLKKYTMKEGELKLKYRQTENGSEEEKDAYAELFLNSQKRRVLNEIIEFELAQLFTPTAPEEEGIAVTQAGAVFKIQSTKTRQIIVMMGSM